MKTNEYVTLTDLIDWVESQPRFNPKTDLKRMKEALFMQHIDLSNTFMIHVAGTNGKGSVTQYLTQMFVEQGLHVGTFSSPYIIRFNERLQIDGKPLTDDILLDLLSEIKTFNHQFEQHYGERLSFFELLTLAAFIVFMRTSLDVVIMEVGIGGLLDATNAYDHYDLSLITNIGFDHMKQLGNTLASIAFNKLGILREKGHLITTVDQSLHPYFKAYTEKLNVDAMLLDPISDIVSDIPLVFTYHHVTYESGLTGSFQVKNAILALEAAKASPFNLTLKHIKDGLKHTYLPGRFQHIRPHVIVDGAHNTHAIEALIKALQLTYPQQRFHFIFSVLGDKDINQMLAKLSTVSNRIDLVSFPDPRFISLSNYQSDRFKYIDGDVISYIDKVTKEIAVDEIIVITGSLHFAGFVLKNYK